MGPLLFKDVKIYQFHVQQEEHLKIVKYKDQDSQLAYGFHLLHLVLKSHVQQLI